MIILELIVHLVVDSYESLCFIYLTITNCVFFMNLKVILYQNKTIFKF